MQILMERAAVIEAKTGINRQTISERYRIADECGSRNRHATNVGGRAGDSFGRQPVSSDISHASRDKAARFVLAPFKLPSNLQLVVSSERGWTVVAERRLRRRARDLQLDKALRSTGADTCDAVEPPGDSASAQIVVTIEDESSNAHIPDAVRSQCVCEMAERHCRR